VEAAAADAEGVAGEDSAVGEEGVGVVEVSE
jgi:hypothetical protein